jgi:hypothetical protein
LALPAALGAVGGDDADESFRQFLAREKRDYQYRAARRLEAQNGPRAGWLEAVTEYSPATGFRYQVTAEGGSPYMREKVLRGVLDAERDLIARGTRRFDLVHANYAFQPKGIDASGLATIVLTPKREDPVLINGTMFLRPGDGELVRLQGRLAKNPSFWIKSVDVTRLYERIDGLVVPVALESTAQVRFFGPASLKMSYTYLEIDGRQVTAVTARNSR